MDLEALRAKLRERAPRAANGRWFDIKNADGAAGDTAVVRIYDYIDPWGVSAEGFAAELDTITASKIEVQINSPGGSVWDGIAIFNSLRAHPAHITTRVDGMAASAASVIVQAGDHRVMMHAGQMMIHDAWGMFVGSADEMRTFADVLDQQSSIIAGIYAQRAGGDRTADTFRELMLAETWLTDQGAVDLGLADEVLTPAPAKDQGDNKNTIDADELRAALGLDELAAKVDDLFAKIPAPAAGTPDSTLEDGTPDPEATAAESFLRAVLAHTPGENR